ncbi:rhodanese-like domain-containing protein [Rariglobus hedericola]|uniref:Rhodanese-like domain-containing protein n=1 Tax=Rariglobus hedericola TaxID=2597822 RepID=A0A556QR10_9BACT|nr:rhodanese-like domain-containing protein [Rariglobus hedericola]TSJ79074.1 rhodanese-like domain-containing protein [Rariglobus hedericola]
MKNILCLFACVVSLPFAAFCADESASSKGLSNPLIDYSAFQNAVLKTGPIRAQRRLTEAEFQAKMREPGAVLFDARSGPMFGRLHIGGAVNLTFPDFTEERLAKIIPTKDTLVLIYCNNNFLGSPVAMASKIAPASLNVSTYVTLNSYGYTNIYELGPLLDVKTTLLPLAGTEMAERAAGGK